MSNHDEPVQTPETTPEEPAPRPAPRPTPPGRLRGPILGLLLAVGLAGLAGGIYLYFQREPAPVAKTEAPPVKDVYYCPMHPQYKSDKPADCPICSMKLVKMETGAGQTGMPVKDVYYCPMHPQYKSDKPADCPICSMKLVKMETGTGQTGMPGMEGGTGTPAANTIFIDPQRQQLIGVQSVPVVSQPLEKLIRAAGKVEQDERKLTHIHTKVTGYLEEVFVNYVGKQVKAGDPLFTIYSPDLVATQEEYLLALRSSRELGGSAIPEIAGSSRTLLEAARRRLKLWDVTDEEIRTLEREGKARRTLTFYSPVSGIVTERAAYHHGRYVTPEMDLYTIVDFSSVWITGEVYESELPFVKVGQSAEIEFPYATQKNAARRGTITFIYPYLEPKTRTAKIRLECPNRNLELKPEMFVNLKLAIHLGEHLVVPEDAVLDTGTETYVFVDHGDGHFEPRLVKVGVQAGGFTAVNEGLTLDERVVTAANFILDSESRLKGVFAAMMKPGAGMAMETVPANPTKIEIVEPKAAQVGKNQFRVAVTDSAGNPVPDAEVTVRLLMPPMGSMPPMTAQTTLHSEGNGTYRGELAVEMAGTWQTTVEVKKAGQTLGSLQSTLNAR